MKKMVVCLLVGFMLGLSGTAIAATNETVQAAFAKFILKIDDKQSVEIEPLVYNGTTYLPVRAIAVLFGREVNYDDASRTIKLTSENPKQGDDNVQTTELEWVPLRQVKEENNFVTILIPDPKIPEMKIIVNEKEYLVTIPNEGETLDVPFGKIKIENGITYLDKTAVKNILDQ